MDSSQEKKQILILTSSTGSGHDARAYALKEWFHKLYNDSTEVRIEHLLENASHTGNFGVNLYNWIQKYIPFFHYIYWFIIEALGQLQRIRLMIGRSYYKKLISEYKPHLIISVHDFLNIGYFRIARKVLGKDKVRCVIYCGEFSGGFGYSINWIDPSADWFVSRTQMAQEFAFKLKAPQERSAVFLGLLPPKVYSSRLSSNEVTIFREKELGLKKNLFTVFLTTGGNGANNHIELLEALYFHRNDVQAIVICGRNHSAYRQVLAWKEAHKDFSLYVEGHSEQVSQLIQASDLVVAKGGGNTAAKTFFLGTPILFNGLQGFMPQEKVTLKFFLKNKAARIFNSVTDFESLIAKWKYFGPEYADMLTHFKSLKKEDMSPEIFFQKLMALAEEAAR